MPTLPGSAGGKACWGAPQPGLSLSLSSRVLLQEAVDGPTGVTHGLVELRPRLSLSRIVCMFSAELYLFQQSRGGTKKQTSKQASNKRASSKQAAASKQQASK